VNEAEGQNWSGGEIRRRRLLKIMEQFKLEVLYPQAARLFPVYALQTQSFQAWDQCSVPRFHNRLVPDARFAAGMALSVWCCVLHAGWWQCSRGASRVFQKQKALASELAALKPVPGALPRELGSPSAPCLRL